MTARIKTTTATYVDTSAWIALLAREPAGDDVSRLLVTAGDAVCTADWTQVEVASALGVKARRGDISATAARVLCDAFDELLLEGDVHVLPVQESDLGTAAVLCRHVASGLRAGDALHLAVAQRSGCTHFLGLDQILNRNAALAGFAISLPHAQ